jgi:hypothetical protein
MARAAKIYYRLDTLEASLVEQLVHHLTACADGRNDLLFCAAEFIPAHYPSNMPTALADELLGQVEVIRRLREKVGEPFQASLGWRFRECCRKWNDDSDPQRGNAQAIAKRLLAQIVAARSKGAAEPLVPPDRRPAAR